MPIFGLLKADVPIAQLEEYIQQNPGCVNTEEIGGEYPLAFAIDQRATTEQIRCLLRHGANPNPPYHANVSNIPLRIAVLKKRPEIVELLIAHGAKVKEKYRHMDGESETILMSAVHYCLQNHYDLDFSENIKILLKHGANPNDKWGDTYASVLDIAIQNKQSKAVKYLLEAGAKPASLSILKLPILLITVENIESDISYGKKLSEESVDIVESLLEHGADPHLKNISGISFSSWLNGKIDYPASVAAKDQFLALRGYMNFKQGNVTSAIEDWLAINDPKVISPKINRLIGEIFKSSILETAGFDSNELLVKSLMHLQADPHPTAEALLDGLASEEEMGESAAYDKLSSQSRQLEDEEKTSKWDALTEETPWSTFDEKWEGVSEKVKLEIKKEKDKRSSTVENKRDITISSDILEEKKISEESKADISLTLDTPKGKSPLTKKIEEKTYLLQTKHHELQLLGWDSLNKEMRNFHRYLIKRKAESGIFVKWSKDYKTRLAIYQKLCALKRECEMLPPKNNSQTQDILNKMTIYINAQLQHISNKRCAESLRKILQVILPIQHSILQDFKAGLNRRL